MLELSPSLLSADFTNLKSDIEILDKSGVKYLHLDVMDGMFVPNISFGPMIIKQLRPLTNMVFDVHLMIEDPDRYVQSFKDAGADILTVHYEACKHLHRTISYIKSLGMKAGVSLNPATNIDVLDYVLEDLDLVLVMSVNPGFGGQSFIPSALDIFRFPIFVIFFNFLQVENKVYNSVILQFLNTSMSTLSKE